MAAVTGRGVGGGQELPDLSVNLVNPVHGDVGLTSAGVDDLLPKV